MVFNPKKLQYSWITIQIGILLLHIMLLWLVQFHLIYLPLGLFCIVIYAENCVIIMLISKNCRYKWINGWLAMFWKFSMYMLLYWLLCILLCFLEGVCLYYIHLLLHLSWFCIGRINIYLLIFVQSHSLTTIRLIAELERYYLELLLCIVYLLLFSLELHL